MAERLSVLMPVYNAQSFLVPALESLLAQTVSAFELIAVDDGSTDASPEILQAYAAKDRRIRVIRKDQNQGVAAALNTGLAQCRGHLVARADADDLYARNRFARQLAFLDRRPGVGVVSCGFQRITEDGRLLDIDRPVTGSARLRFCMTLVNCLLHPGAIFRAGLVRAVGGYDERFWTAQDSDLWARLAPLTEFDNVPEILVRYRVHPASRMKTRGEAGRQLSLSVPQRRLAAYLDRPVSLEETAAAAGLFWGARSMNIAAIRAGLLVLEELAAKAAAIEPASVRRYFRLKVARALVRQARHRRRRAQAALYVEAARWRSDVMIAELGGLVVRQSRHQRLAQKIDARRW